MVEVPFSRMRFYNSSYLWLQKLWWKMIRSKKRSLGISPFSFIIRPYSYSHVRTYARASWMMTRKRKRREKESPIIRTCIPGFRISQLSFFFPLLTVLLCHRFYKKPFYFSPRTAVFFWSISFIWEEKPFNYIFYGRKNSGRARKKFLLLRTNKPPYTNFIKSLKVTHTRTAWECLKWVFLAAAAAAAAAACNLKTTT